MQRSSGPASPVFSSSPPWRRRPRRGRRHRPRRGLRGTRSCPRRPCPTTGPDAVTNGRSCPTGAPADSAAGALERATGGRLGRPARFGFGLSRRARSARRDLGRFPAATTYWNFDVNNVSQQVGVVRRRRRAEGDEILFYEACAEPARDGLLHRHARSALAAPATATAGEPFTVTVVEYDDSPRHAAPRRRPAGATVAGGGQPTRRPTPHGHRHADGRPSRARSRWSPPRRARCATRRGGHRSAPPVYAVPTRRRRPRPRRPHDADRARHDGSGVDDPRPERPQVFKRARAPRTLRGRVRRGRRRSASVKLALTRRRVKKRCTGFDAVEERFVKIRCGRRPRFFVGTDKTVSLPAAEAAGQGPLRVRRGRDRQPPATASASSAAATRWCSGSE